MIKIRVLIYLSFLSGFLYTFNSDCLAQAQTETNVGEDSFSIDIDNEILKAYKSPFPYCRSKQHLTLLHLLERNYFPSQFIISADSLENLIEPVVATKNIQKNFINNILLFSLTQSESSDRSCNALIRAAGIAQHNMYDPELALTVYELAEKNGCNAAQDSIKFVKKFMFDNNQILHVLNVNYLQKNTTELQDYYKVLEKSLYEYSKSDLLDEVRLRLGDIAYILKNNKGIVKYYSQVLDNNLDSEKAKEISSRCDLALGKIHHQQLFFLLIVGYILSLFIMIFRLKNGQGFDTACFIKNTVILLFIYSLLSILVLVLDQKLSAGFLSSWLQSEKVVLKDPIILLHFYEILPQKIFINMLLLGFIPVLYALFYISFKKSHSKILLLSSLLILVSSIWVHFSLNYIFDDSMKPKGFMTTSRFYFNGNIDLIIDKDPNILINAVKNEPDEVKMKVKRMIEKHQAKKSEELKKK